jgi:ribosomal protein RSM22 (predicted rRNA methylase)
MKRGGHVIVDLCTKTGIFERRIAAKSHGPEFK